MKFHIISYDNLLDYDNNSSGKLVGFFSGFPIKHNDYPSPYYLELTATQSVADEIIYKKNDVLEVIKLFKKQYENDVYYIGFLNALEEYANQHLQDILDQLLKERQQINLDAQGIARRLDDNIKRIEEIKERMNTP